MNIIKIFVCCPTLKFMSQMSSLDLTPKVLPWIIFSVWSLSVKFSVSSLCFKFTTASHTWLCCSPLHSFLPADCVPPLCAVFSVLRYISQCLICCYCCCWIGPLVFECGNALPAFLVTWKSWYVPTFVSNMLFHGILELEATKILHNAQIQELTKLLWVFVY